MAGVWGGEEMKEMITTFCGKPIHECSREELIEALDRIMKDRYEVTQSLINTEIQDLKKELHIKNELIDKLVKR